MKNLHANILSIFAIFASLSTTATAATCELDFNGCKTGAAKITANGRALTNCLWMAEVGSTSAKLARVGACSPRAKTCELKSSGCKAGAAWISYEGSKLTECQWMDELAATYASAVKGGICYYGTQVCEYRPGSACKTGAGQIFAGDQQLTACEWLDNAGRIMTSLRRSGACN